MRTAAAVVKGFVRISGGELDGAAVMGYIYCTAVARVAAQASGFKLVVVASITTKYFIRAHMIYTAVFYTSSLHMCFCVYMRLSYRNMKF